MQELAVALLRGKPVQILIQDTAEAARARSP